MKLWKTFDFVCDRSVLNFINDLISMKKNGSPSFNLIAIFNNDNQRSNIIWILSVANAVSITLTLISTRFEWILSRFYMKDFPFLERIVFWRKNFHQKKIKKKQSFKSINRTKKTKVILRYWNNLRRCVLFQSFPQTLFNQPISNQPNYQCHQSNSNKLNLFMQILKFQFRLLLIVYDSY